MDEKALMMFIHRIISTSSVDNQSLNALRDLESILKKQGIPPAQLSILEATIKGMTESGKTMKAQVSTLPELSPEALRTAVQRAHEEMLRLEEAMRNGRC